MSTPAQRLESERSKYPAMQVDEILVWRVWLKSHQAEYDRFDYNVYIGEARDPGPLFSDVIRAMAIALRQLRLDAVGYQGDRATIFEVERNAAPRSIGQILSYSAVWNEQQMQPANPALVIVCATMSPHIAGVAAANNIRIDLVPDVNFSVLAPGRLIPEP